MTLQQLKYLIAIAQFGSINAAAQNLYASQSNLSCAMKDLEIELGIQIFSRNNRGVALTNEGVELLGYARQVVEQADMLEARYKKSEAPQQRLYISTQHYAFSVEAFVNVVEACAAKNFDYKLRETTTAAIIDDIAAFRSEIGVLYVDSFNKRVIKKALKDANATFTPLFEANVHVFVGENHPLATKKILSQKDLQKWPRYSFEQGTTNSFYYSEEPFSYMTHTKNIAISDRGTLTNLLTKHNGYTLSTGVLSSEMQSGIVSIPLEGKGKMRVGYIIHTQHKQTELMTQYIKELCCVVQGYKGVIPL